MRKVFPRREAFSSSVYKSTYSGHFILSENFGFLTTFLTVITETEKQPSKNHEQTKVSVILSNNKELQLQTRSKYSLSPFHFP